MYRRTIAALRWPVCAMMARSETPACADTALASVGKLILRAPAAAWHLR